MALPPFLCRRAAHFRALRENRLRPPPFLAAARLMPDAVLQAKVIPVVEDDCLRTLPIGAVATTNAAQVFVVLGQALATRVIPVVPKRAQVTQTHGLGIPGDGLEEVVAVERQIS